MRLEEGAAVRNPRRRGGAPVGFLEEIGEVEASAILYLRLWCAGEDGRRRVQGDFNLFLGSAGGRRAIRALGSLVTLIYEHGRRPLMRHHETCRCVGGDEAAFANMVAAALADEREDAILLATLFMRADVAMLTVSLAQDFGIALRTIVKRIAAGGTVEAAPVEAAPVAGERRTLH